MENSIDQFIVSFIYTTISLIIIMPVFILIERKRRKRFIRVLEEKNSLLLETLADADEMLNELNRLSNYIADLLEEKKNEFNVEADTKTYEADAVKDNEVNEGNDKIEKDTADKSEISVSAEKYALGFTQEREIHNIVFELLDRGMSCEEIAKELNRGKGEVQLIIDMKKYY